jgi:putative NIF3 family GTP cyclohydrolase 1 type 2
MSLQAFVEHVHSALPVGVAGVKATGDPQAMIQRIAVCGGAGGSALPAVLAADVDAYVTSDLSHHRAGEFVDDADGGKPFLIDATHFGTEWPWLQQAADLLTSDLATFGTTVETTISLLSTDPWRIHSH